LVGIESSDDAAVYQISDTQALVLTIDFFPPIVDDPWHFGAIAACNALSDVYAMGGTPILALNVTCFPEGMDLGILSEILKGGLAKAEEAGVMIVGGHTINDDEPKYGMAVTGLIEPGKQLTNTCAKVGDRLILTKPIGTGIITTAGKNGVADEDNLATAIDVMESLNKGAAESMLHIGVNACTDITGFGLLGHLQTMADASGVSAIVKMGDVPILPGVTALVAEGVFPGGTQRNLNFINPFVAWSPDLKYEDKIILSDAQTSGGLLMSVSPEKTQDLLNSLSSHGVKGAVIIGEIVKRHTEFMLRVLP
jgi:selenide,water dikinase